MNDVTLRKVKKSLMLQASWVVYIVFREVTRKTIKLKIKDSRCFYSPVRTASRNSWESESRKFLIDYELNKQTVSQSLEKLDKKFNRSINKCSTIRETILREVKIGLDSRRMFERLKWKCVHVSITSRLEIPARMRLDMSAKKYDYCKSVSK